MNAALARSLAGQLYERATFLDRCRAKLRATICPFEKVVSAVPPGAAVLDLGCGDGLLTGLLIASKKAASVVGIDGSKQSVSRARDLVDRMHWSDCVTVVNRNVDGDWPEATFDAITLVDVMHHLNQSIRPGVFRKAHSSLRPGGLLIYKDMAARPWWAMAANFVHDLVFSRQWVRLTPLSEVERMALDAGFMKVAWSTVRVLWYWHEMLVLKKRETEPKPNASPTPSLPNR